MDRAFAPYDPLVSSTYYPKDFWHSVMPVPCHSHNDYWRNRPLWSALMTGCISVEADIWLKDGQLFVGHSMNELKPDHTLSSMYLEPLAVLLQDRLRFSEFGDIVDGQPRKTPGVFYQDPSQTVTLLIDFKSDGEVLWPKVLKALEPLRQRQWLTFWNGKIRAPGPITIVATGNVPFERIIENTTYRDVFFDAPLDQLSLDDLSVSKQDMNTQHEPPAWLIYKYNPSNSYYASSSMSQSLGMLSNFRFSNSQMDLLRYQIKQAKDRMLVPRYWGTPRWPRKFRDSIWELMIKEGIGILNVDDLRAARKGLWGVW
jgi:hypothetical protein